MSRAAAAIPIAKPIGIEMSIPGIPRKYPRVKPMIADRPYAQT
jgi:hypothetical protein